MRCRLVAGLALVAVLATLVPRLAAAGGERWGAAYFPNPPVQDQDGRTLHFYDDLIRGRIVVVSFIYTSCADLCPIATARLAEVKDKLGDRLGRDIFFVSLTVDPEHDTPEKLKAFAEAFNTGPGWTFVTGKPADVTAILEKLGDRSGQRGLAAHRNEILLGNDRLHDWQRDSPLGEIDRLVIAILAMDPQWRDQPRRPVATTAEDRAVPLPQQPGEGMFRKLCAPCHTIGQGARVGPDLNGVTERRDPAWLARFIRDPGAMIAANDPTALQLAAHFPAVRMPRFGLTELDAADMISYLHLRSSRARAADTDAAPH